MSADLADFLLARIAEDEAAATDEAIARVRAGTVVGGPGVPAHAVEQAQEAVVDVHRVRPWAPILSPARILAECDAKRRIVEDFLEYAADYRAAPSDFAAGRRHAALLAVTRAAAVYADHPDYREEWRP